MKVVKTVLGKLRPHFSDGGKFKRLFPLFEAIDAFFLSSSETTESGVHLRDHNDLKRMMSLVIIALIPCTIFGIWNAGYQTYQCHNMTAPFWRVCLEGAVIVLPIIAVSYIVGGFWEVLFAVVRRHEINEGFLVTGLLFPLTLPPSTPLWMVALGISFGVVIGKEVFGGTGMNVVNPALAGRAFLFFAYPAYMTGNIWVSSRPISFAASCEMDAVASATPLSGSTFHSFENIFYGVIPGSIGETCVPAILFGAVFLLILKVASWRIMFSCLLGFVLATFFAGEEILLQLASGGFLFGAVFMATDPVSGPITKSGKLIYGVLIGLLAVAIRLGNPAYPEGMMLAILFMNFISPLIDYIITRIHIKRRRYARKS